MTWKHWIALVSLMLPFAIAIVVAEISVAAKWVLGGGLVWFTLIYANWVEEEIKESRAESGSEEKR